MTINSNRELTIFGWQFRTNSKVFKKKKVLSFVFKINGTALFDAALQYYILLSAFPELPDSWSGKVIS